MYWQLFLHIIFDQYYCHSTNLYQKGGQDISQYPSVLSKNLFGIALNVTQVGMFMSIGLVGLNLGIHNYKLYIPHFKRWGVLMSNFGMDISSLQRSWKNPCPKVLPNHTSSLISDLMHPTYSCIAFWNCRPPTK